MQVIADLQLHSKYARAVSPQMVIPQIWEWAKIKGIGLIATGDWTHPLWMREIKNDLEETGSGLLRLKIQNSNDKIQIENGPLFLLETEVSCIYSQGGKLRRIHTLIWSPSIEVSEKINKKLINLGANLMSDGRPIIGLTSRQVCEVVLSVDPKCLIIPAHVWTPWFSLYGSESGFDSIEECFGEFSRYIYAVETGLSSNPAMNWRIKELDTRSIVSFSDAHSGPKLGREATVFELEELSFKAIREAIMVPASVPIQSGLRRGEARNKIAYTIEFYPEEGKYHYTGHRNCNVRQTPDETRSKGTVCPVCGRKLTVGVMHRVDQLAGRSESELKLSKKNIDKIAVEVYYSSQFPEKTPYTMLVPLHEILAEVFGSLPTSKNILLSIKSPELTKVSGDRVAEAIERVRNAQIYVDPGYDGVFGKVKIWYEKKDEKKTDAKEQMSLF